MSGETEEGRRTPARDDRQDDDRKRRREHVFGDVLPDGTTDELGEGWGESTPDESDGPGAARDDWLRGEVPPHHG
jgi:hypothetical protein